MNGRLTGLLNMTEFLAPAQQSLSVATILVVDDDPETRVLLNSVLGDELGHTLVFAKDGEAGIDVFRRTHPELVITDLVMPRLDGIRLIDHLKEVYPTSTIIAMSGKAQDLLKRAEALGAEVALTKPLQRVQESGEGCISRGLHWKSGKDRTQCVEPRSDLHACPLPTLPRSSPAR